VLVGFCFGAQWPLLYAVISKLLGLKMLNGTTDTMCICASSGAFRRMAYLQTTFVRYGLCASKYFDAMEIVNISFLMSLLHKEKLSSGGAIALLSPNIVVSAYIMLREPIRSMGQLPLEEA
jgi:hypothetical protein